MFETFQIDILKSQFKFRISKLKLLTLSLVSLITVKHYISFSNISFDINLQIGEYI